MNGVRPLVPADEVGPGGGGGPRLPAKVALQHGIAQADVGASNQDIHCLDLRHGCGGGGAGRSERPASKAAMPPATTAMINTMIRAGFIPALPTITLHPTRAQTLT